MERKRSGTALLPGAWDRDYPISASATGNTSLYAGLCQLQGAKCQAKFSISAISGIVSIKTIPFQPHPDTTPRSVVLLPTRVSSSVNPGLHLTAKTEFQQCLTDIHHGRVCVDSDASNTFILVLASKTFQVDWSMTGSRHLPKFLIRTRNGQGGI